VEAELFAYRAAALSLSKHTMRMHLGGMHGQLAIGPMGSLAVAAFQYAARRQCAAALCCKVGEAARLLQTTGGPAVPRVSQIEMVGEYPVARLRFIDPALPVQLELERSALSRR